MKQKSSSAGVSETIGFVIVMSIIFLSIGMVYANAIPVLEDTQEAEHISNSQKTFNTLQNNLNEVVERDVPRRGTEIRLYESTVTADEQTFWMNVSNETSPAPSDFVRNRTSSNIMYKHEGERIIYENGAIIRSSRNRNGSGMIKEPDWTVRESNGDVTVLIRYMRVISSGTISGDGTVLIRARDFGRRNPIEEELRNKKEMTIRIKSEHAGAWERYFEELAEVDSGITVNTGVGPKQAEIEFDLDDNNDRIIYTENILSADMIE